MAEEPVEEKEHMSKGDRKRYGATIRIFLKTLNNMLDRHDKIRDPMTRNALILDKMCAGMDLLGGFADVLPKETGFDREFCDEVHATIERLKRVINSLFEWIQNPTYSNEHPIGREMMKQGQASLDAGYVRALDE